jgi:hypothetical protein
MLSVVGASVARRRALLLPRDARTEGSRRIREELRRQTFAAIARRLRCDEGTVRRLATEAGRPSLVLRARAADILGIPEHAWDEPPFAADVYSSGEPPTARPAYINGTRGIPGHPH